MKLVFDPDRCSIFTVCRGTLPELFGEDDDGLTVLLGDGEVPSGLAERAARAASECPSGAIRVSE